VNPRLNRIPLARWGGPNDDREALPLVVLCVLCDEVIDDGKRLPAPTVYRCPVCGPICDRCVGYEPTCPVCGAAVEEDAK
jgi:hypothetical protein